jgi:hypothetical protein
MKPFSSLALALCLSSSYTLLAQESELPADWYDQWNQMRSEFMEVASDDIPEEETIDPSKLGCDCYGATMTAADAYYTHVFKKKGLLGAPICKRVTVKDPQGKDRILLKCTLTFTDGHKVTTDCDPNFFGSFAVSVDEASMEHIERMCIFIVSKYYDKNRDVCPYDIIEWRCGRE